MQETGAGESKVDQKGMLYSYLLDGEGGVVEQDKGEPFAGAWMHFDYSIPATGETLGALGLDEALVESLTRTDTRPRTLGLDGRILVVLRAVNINPGSDPEDMVSLRFLIEPDRLITVRQRRVFSVQDVRERLLAGEGPATVADLLIEIIDGVVRRVSDFVELIESQVDECEQAALDRQIGSTRMRVGEIRRQAAIFRRFLAPQREALDTLSRLAAKNMDDNQAYRLRELYDRMVRCLEDLDLAREQALVLQEQLLNSIVEQQNARMYVLAIITAVFLPITFLTGVFGMNVGGLPGTESSAGFLVVMLISIAVAFLVLGILRWKRWF